MAEQKGDAIVFRRQGFAAQERDRLRSDRDTELLHSELFSADKLKYQVVALAGSHGVDGRPGKDRLLPRLAENERVRVTAYDVVTAAATPGQRILPAV